MSQDIYPSYRFYVEIGSAPRALFTEISGLQVETDIFEYAEGGNNSFIHRLPGRTKVSNITLKRGMTTSNELFAWYGQWLNGKHTPQNVTVVMYDTAGNALLRWTFLNAYPVKWVGPQFTANGAQAAIETLELAHEGLQVE
jgi:phage tail-like protein